MTKLSMITLLALAIFSLNAFSADYAVDNKATKLKWVGEKFGGEHFGNVNVKTGTITVEDNKITGGNFVMDMESITVEDLEPGEWNDKLLGHLKSDDFFSVANHKTSEFKIFAVKDKGNGKLKITGKLTIKGITKQVSFEADYKMKGEQLMASGKLSIDRTKFDIKYGSGSFFDIAQDKLIYDDFVIEIDLVANKQMVAGK